jgi:hypothetical protein
MRIQLGTIALPHQHESDLYIINDEALSERSLLWIFKIEKPLGNKGGIELGEIQVFH